MGNVKSENEHRQFIHSRLKSLPSLPGVYEMKNEGGETLYVGKAKNLKNRVKSYFLSSAKHSPRITKLLEKTHDLSWTETSSELEALVLESNLIKEKRPKFNILLRDDKNFLYIKITLQEDYPRIFSTRRIVRDGSMYFGPKTSSSAVQKTLELLQNIFLFRTTPLEITELEEGKVSVKSLGNTKYPCLNFHLKKCEAPCIGKISKAEYRQRIDHAIRFLKGDYHLVEQDVESNMKKAALEKKFERAGHFRDLLFAIRSIAERQIVSAPDELSADVIGSFEKFGRVFFHVFSIRDGKVINSETFSLPYEGDISECLAAFLREHSERVADAPKNLIVSPAVFPKEEEEAWEFFFRKAWGNKLDISLPQKGKRNDLIKLAEQNAESYAIRNAASFLKADESSDKSLAILQKKLCLPNLPKRIECYDISHFGGTETGASMVVFEDGEAKNEDYRHFSIHSLEKGKIDDFASMREVLSRRLLRLPKILSEHKSIALVSRKKDFQIFTTLSPLPHPEGQKIWGLFEEKDSQKIPLGGIFFSSHTKEQIECSSPMSIPPYEFSEDEVQILLERFIKTQKANNLFWRMETKWKSVFERLGFLSVSLSKKVIRLPEVLLQENPERLYFLSPSKKKKQESFEKIPDLIVIDGGKGQLSSAYSSLLASPYAQRIAICSLAKKYEEVFLPNSPAAVNITKDSPEGKLLQRIRDEAHRFAITKNRVDREKTAQKSLLDNISGVGGKTKKLLLQTFGDISGIRSASDQELLKVVSKKVLLSLRENL
jgi:excinuclease ABC subunit C